MATMTLLLSLLSGIVSGAIGWIAAAALTMLGRGVLGVSDFESARGMLSIWGHRPARRDLADFVAAPGLTQPRKAGPDEAFEIWVE